MKEEGKNKGSNKEGRKEVFLEILVMYISLVIRVVRISFVNCYVYFDFLIFNVFKK